jgi:hypothetical protein
MDLGIARSLRLLSEEYLVEASRIEAAAPTPEAN